MNIVLLGAPGSGKGTLAAQLKKHYDIPHVSSGDIIRAEIKAGSSLGKAVADSTAKGILLTDTPEFMGKLLETIKQRLLQPDCQHGFILDGAPRTLWQVTELDRLLALIGKDIDAVVLLEVTHQNIVERLAGRMVCKICSLSYHQATNPPQVTNTCDRCHQLLSRRSDDDEDVVINRLAIYQQTIGDIITTYSDRKLLITVDGDTTPRQVFQSVSKKLYPRDYLQNRIPSYPTPQGFPFYNLVEIYKDPCLMRYAVGRFISQTKDFDYLVAPEARALPLFGAMSYQMGKPGVFLRKVGKLPAAAPKLSASYETAYSTDTIEMNYDSNLRDKSVIILDDGISSGGTILAVIELMEKAGARVVGIMALIRYHYRKVVPEYQPWESITFTLFDL